MTKKIDNGGPAFPFILQGPKIEGDSQGMTLRDWFAGQALIGLLFNAETILKSSKESGNTATQELITASYELSDAMLKERKRNDQT